MGQANLEGVHFERSGCGSAENYSFHKGADPKIINSWEENMPICKYIALNKYYQPK